MTDIQTFTEHLLKQKESELAAKRQRHVEKEHDVLTQALARIAQNEKLEIDKIVQDIQLTEIIEKQKIDNQKRNHLLAHKQEKLLSLFDDVTMMMEAWNKEQFTTFLYSVLTQMDTTKQYTLHIGDKTHFAFQMTECALNQLRLDGQEQGILLPRNIQLASAKLPSVAGFILEENGIQYNYLFHSLVNAVKQDYIGELSQKLTR